MYPIIILQIFCNHNGKGHSLWVGTPNAAFGGNLRSRLPHEGEISHFPVSLPARSSHHSPELQAHMLCDILDGEHKSPWMLTRPWSLNPAVLLLPAP